MTERKKLLCPVDFSSGSERAVEHATALAKSLGSDIELLHVYQLPAIALPEAPIMATAEMITEITDHAQRALNAHRDKVIGSGIQVTTKLSEGDAYRVICDRAKEINAEMIVMGTHGRMGFKRFLLGSVAERVVRTSTVPVLTVHLPESAA